MTTSRETPDTESERGVERQNRVSAGFGRSEISAAERELQEILATARALGIETETGTGRSGDRHDGGGGAG